MRRPKERGESDTEGGGVVVGQAEQGGDGRDVALDGGAVVFKTQHLMDIHPLITPIPSPRADIP